MLAVYFVIIISSTSLPGGNLVDGLPPAASLSEIMSACNARAPDEGGMMNSLLAQS